MQSFIQNNLFKMYQLNEIVTGKTAVEKTDYQSPRL